MHALTWFVTSFVLAASSYCASAQPGEPLHYEFVLRRGAGTTVCEAYVKRLQKTDFVAPPYCDRPDETAIPGFKKLNRVYLSADEVFKLDRQVHGFLTRQDLHDWEKTQQEKARLGLPVETDENVRTIINQQFRRSNDFQKHYRFERPVDVDNDGKPDHLVIWRETGYVCGEPLARDPRPARAPTYALLLDDQGNVDAARTKEIFGHPSGGYVVQFKDNDGKTVQRTSESFRPIGRTLGVIVFQDKVYFDTFYDSWGDLNNARRKDPQIHNTLGLFKRERGRTQAVCEVLWKEPNN
jgi:hypothetical protein